MKTEIIGDAFDLIESFTRVFDIDVDELINDLKKLKEKYPQYKRLYLEDIGVDEVVYQVIGEKS